MRTTTNATLLGSSVFDDKFRLKVFAAYEDVATGKGAKETCDALRNNLGQDWAVETQIVSFKMLSMPEWLCAAAVEAACADVLIVSCHGNRLPPCVQDWVGLWLSSGPRATSLVALFACSPENAARVQRAKNYLSMTADLAGMQFFCRLAASAEAPSPRRFSWSGLTEGASS